MGQCDDTRASRHSPSCYLWACLAAGLAGALWLSMPLSHPEALFHTPTSAAHGVRRPMATGHPTMRQTGLPAFALPHVRSAPAAGGPAAAPSAQTRGTTGPVARGPASYARVALDAAALVLDSGIAFLVATAVALRLSLRAPRRPMHACTVTATEDKVDEQQAAEPEGEAFSWTKQWWPLAVPEHLDPGRPHSLRLLGKELVVWYDKNSAQWKVFEDACPHRLVPLSEGRVEDDGTLLCAYHAWRFDGDGKCVHAPQVEADAQAQFTKSDRTCAVPHPCQELDGILWVWGEPGGPGSNTAFEANLKSPLRTPEMHDPALEGRVDPKPLSSREMAYGWDYFIENVVDPAHVPATHHNVQGDRYSDPQPIEITFDRPMTLSGGFKMRAKGLSKETPMKASTEFIPPCLVRINTEGDDGAGNSLMLYATPSRPGYVRFIGRQLFKLTPDGQRGKGFGGPLAMDMPHWLGHVLSPLFLHQDMVFLHAQEKILSKRGYNTNVEGTDAKEYTGNILALSCDKGVLAFRKWMALAGGTIPWAPGTAPLPEREFNKDKLFDTWHSHTKDCQYCLGALKNIKRIRNGLIVAGSLALGLGIGASPWRLLVALACFGLAYGLEKFKGLFYKYEFEHALND